MAIGRITGPMLFSNLERQGVDLAIDGNLIYAAVTSRTVGINNPTPAYPLDVPGNVKIANIIVLGNTITSNTGKVDLGSVANVQIKGGSPNYILSTDGAGNLTWANLQSLTLLEGFDGNNIPLGSNTVGSFGNALTFTTDTKVTDAIAALNQLLGNITNSTGSTIHAGTITVNGTDVYSNLSSTSANVSVLQSNAASQATDINTLYSNAATQATYINAINANVAAANVNIATLLSEAYSNANVASYLTIFNGNINAGNVTLSGNLKTDYISGNIGNVVTFTSTGAVKLPIGTTANRPTGAAGELRFNTDINQVEYFNGTSWVGVTNTVTEQTIVGDNVTQTFNLQQTSTAVGILVSINGTLQNPASPYSAYTVSGNQITFAEAPLDTDVVDIRFLAGISTLNNTLTDDLTVSGNLTLGGILSQPLTTKANNSPGTSGQVCWDGNYIYICTSTNTWKRVSLSSF